MKLRMFAAGCCMLVATTGIRADLADGLVLHYTFDEDLGTTVQNQAGTLFHGVVRGGATYVPDGHSGGAYALDGVDDYIEVAGFPSSSTKYSMSLWFTTDSSVNFLENRNLISDNRRYQVAGEIVDGYQRFFSFALNSFDFGPAFPFSTAPVFLPPGTWHHLAMVVDDMDRPVGRIYVDGQLVGADTIDGVNYGGQQMLIGALNNDSFIGPRLFWHGQVDDVRIYNRALAPEEVAELYGPAGPPPPGGEAVAVVHSIAFSAEPDGPGDQTVFAETDTLHIRLRDALLASADHACAVATLKQHGERHSKGSHKGKKPKNPRPLSVVLEPQEDGSFLGSVDLSSFNPGTLHVTLGAAADEHNVRLFKAHIEIE
jgi:hypothetical protein